ncbi:hypothetical protein EYR38_008642 [Pleurotus pulmonarius]|nr:hypothetical protein EYR38_008642 [Pleurotus pulmonarius]
MSDQPQPLAAFSSYEYLSHLKNSGRLEGSLPYDIMLEAYIALFIGILGASLSAPTLKQITWASEMQTRYVKLSYTSSNALIT